MTIAIEKEGRRHYITGNTYPIKDQLRSAGCKWDPDRKAWWTGKADVAAKFAGAKPESNGNGNGGQAADGEATVVAGRAEYKGRMYYLVGRINRGRTRWDNDEVQPVYTKDGSKMLLCFRDGSKQFWAFRDAVAIKKQYSQPQTIGGLKEFAERAKSDEPRCAECGGFGDLVRDLEDGLMKHYNCCDIPA